MEKLKEWWAAILLVGLVTFCVMTLVSHTAPFRIHVSGGLFGFEYEVQIPHKYLTREMVDKHNEAFLEAIGDLAKDD